MHVLRSLLSRSPVELGQIDHPPPVTVDGKYTFAPVSILGRGAFCTAILAQVSSEELNPLLVVMKKENAVSLKAHDVALVQLQNECGVLRQINDNLLECTYLPKLFEHDWEVTSTSPFIPLLPVGQALNQKCSSLSATERLVEAFKLYANITAGLKAVHEKLSLCHRDVRPENVVYHPENDCYVIIDWGLAAPPGALMHEHKGGRAFCHDEVAMAILRRIQIPFTCEHDLAAVRYVAYVFSEGPAFKVSAWVDLTVRFVQERARIVGTFLV